MSDNYRETGRNRDQRWAVGIGLMNNYARALEGAMFLPKRFEEPPRLKGKDTPADFLAQVIREYKTTSHTPELIYKTWQAIWNAWGEPIGHSFDVPACDRTSEQLEALRAEVRGVLLVPDEIYTKEGLALLGRIFPKMGNWSVGENTTVVNEREGEGCIDVEMTVDAPYRTDRGYMERQFLEAIAADGRKGQRLATYIVGSQFNNLLTDRFFDEGSTLSRLPGSSAEGSALDAFFDLRGRLNVRPLLDPQFQNPLLGGRSEGVKKA